MLIFLIPQVFAYNSLENQNISAESATVSINLKFGKDLPSTSFLRESVPTLDSGVITFYGDQINVSDSRVKVYGSGNGFSLANFDEGIVMFGKYYEDLKNYKINMYFATDIGFQKISLTSMQDKTIKPINTVLTNNTDLNILTDQYERVYNKSNYKFFVKTFNKSVYSGNEFDNFHGKISGAKVSAIIIDSEGKIRDEIIGYVENGVYEGSVYVQENLWQRGWYTVDILVEFGGKSYKEQLSFYVFGEPVSSGGCAKFTNGTCI